jgi:L-amino acid N-acyltransferase YncA
MEIRDAAAADAAGIAAIYNDAVERSTAIWNEILVDAPNRAAWIAARQAAGFPVLAAEEGGEILGYASFGDFRAFDGYRLTVEHSVYVRGDARGRGLGRALLSAVIARARGAGKHAMVAAIEAGNAPSIRLHEDLGFVRVGLMPQVGMKFGRWLDLALLQLTLDGRPTP